MAYEQLIFEGAAAPTTLDGGISNSELTIEITDATGWPSPAAGQYFYIDIDWDVDGKHEKVLCEARSGTTLTAKTSGGRGADDTTGLSHASGAKVRHVGPAIALQEAHDAARQTRGAVTTKGDLLAGTGSLAIARLGVGANATMLIADSAQATGLKYVAPSGDLTVDVNGVFSLASNSVGSAEIAAGAVDSSEIANGAVDLVHMSANSVDSDQYVDGSVDAVHLAAAARPRWALPGFLFDVQLHAGTEEQLSRSTEVAVTDRAVAALEVPVVAPEAGSVIGISVALVSARTAGSAAFTVYINGVSTSFGTTIDDNPTQYGYTTQAAGLDTFAAGDRIDVRVTTSSFAMADIASGEVVVWCQVT